MEAHFGSEFGLSKEKVVEIIRKYDYGTPLSCADNFGKEKEQAINGLLNEYVNLHMTKEFIDLRKEYRRISANEPQYLDALKKLLFPEDYLESPSQPIEPCQDEWKLSMLLVLRDAIHDPAAIRTLLKIDKATYASMAKELTDMGFDLD